MSLQELGRALEAIASRYPGYPDVDLNNPHIKARYEDAEWWRSDLERQYEAQERRWQELLERDGIPRRLQNACFEDADDSEAIRRALDYSRRHVRAGRCLLMAGATGIGKSYAAIAVLRAHRTASRGFWYFPSLCGALLDPQRRQTALDQAKQTWLVVFDDIGVEYVKEGGLVEAFFDEIVWHREGNEQPTIFTTNLTAEQLTARLSDRIIDRLRGWGTVCAVGGQSLRGHLGDG